MRHLGIVASSHYVASGGESFAFDYVTAIGSGANQTAYTFSGVSIGAESASRIIVLTVNWDMGGGSPSISAITVNGISATVDVSIVALRCAAVARVAVPTGTTADIVVTFSAGSANCVIGVFRSVGATLSVADTKTMFDNPSVVTITGQTGGIIVACARAYLAGVVDWTGATEKYDLAYDWYASSGALSAAVGATTIQSGRSGLAAVAYSVS